jgi:dihydropteroate synthase
MTKIVGILNITPDSFSDGGKYISPEAALEHAIDMVKAGADVIDIGAESTRPGAVLLDAEQEWSRLKDTLPLICNNLKNTRISIDTRHPQNAAKALNLGVDWVNDVSGGNNAEMLEIIKDFEADYVVMHGLTIPADPAVTIAENLDAVRVLKNWVFTKMNLLDEAGINLDKVIADVGIGFGKTAKQNWELIYYAEEFLNIGVRVLFGHSEKSFLKTIADNDAGQRGVETSVVSAFLARKNVDYIRVHDVKTNLRAIKTAKIFDEHK